MISDDKTGAMNLVVREQRKRSDLSSDETQALEDLLKRTRSGGKIAIESGKWHHVRVVINDDIMDTYFDDKPIARLKSPRHRAPDQNECRADRQWRADRLRQSASTLARRVKRVEQETESGLF